jgi:hypothetical protein
VIEMKLEDVRHCEEENCVVSARIQQKYKNFLDKNNIKLKKLIETACEEIMREKEEK